MPKRRAGHGPVPIPMAGIYLDAAAPAPARSSSVCGTGLLHPVSLARYTAPLCMVLGSGRRNSDLELFPLIAVGKVAAVAERAGAAFAVLRAGAARRAAGV